MSTRTIRRQYEAVSDDIGDLRTQRPLPNEEIDQVDPFLFLNHHGPLEILQLWVNLPSRLKMTEPNYTGLQKDQIPVVRVEGAAVNLIAGTFGESTGPVRSLTDVHMMTVKLKADGRVMLPAPHDRNVFLYVVRGDIRIGTAVVPALHLVDLNHDGDNVEIEAASDSMILFGHAAPIGEPVVSHGPFVMNTREEIVTAIRDYQAGRFRLAMR